MENLEAAIAEIKQALPGLRLMENEPMSAHSSFKIGGPVRALAMPSDVSALTKICHLLKTHEHAPYMLGNGTNLLFPDEGLKDLFLMSTERLTKLFLLSDGTVYAEAGVALSKLAGFAQQNSLKGLEFASGIPGSVGGGVFMNAGAYGESLDGVIESVVLYYLPEQRLYELTREQCQFAYRTSLFQKLAGCVILSAVFRLETGDAREIAGKMRELNEKRREKQPLDLPSAGSFFKRPEGHFAGALIEQAGLKGCKVGGAQVSEKHAGFIVNLGGASCKDVYDLAMHVRNTVYEKFQVELEPEVRILPPDFKYEDRGPQVPLHFAAAPEITASES